MNGIGRVDPLAGAWGPGAGQATAARSLRDVEPQRQLQLGEATTTPQADFARTLSEVLGEVNDLQLRADQLVGRLAAGQVENLHEVMIAQQEAAIALRLIQEVRDKLVGAYQELMRMQV